jgi:hypothetical protein
MLWVKLTEVASAEDVAGRDGVVFINLDEVFRITSATNGATFIEQSEDNYIYVRETPGQIFEQAARAVAGLPPNAMDAWDTERLEWHKAGRPWTKGPRPVLEFPNDDELES